MFTLPYANAIVWRVTTYRERLHYAELGDCSIQPIEGLEGVTIKVKNTGTEEIKKTDYDRRFQSILENTHRF